MSTKGLGLEERVALVTGAGSGIGAAVARAFLDAGARVVGLDLKPVALEDLIGKSKAHAHAEPGHREFTSFVGDVTRQESVDAAVQDALERYGRLDAVVNCAGITADGVVWKITEEQWQRVLDVNLTGSFRIVRAAIPALRKHGGAIVLVASVNALRGKFGQSNYAASKAGVIALAKSAAIEAAAFNVRVNAVAPGYVDTPMTAKLPQQFKDEALRETPLGRLADPKDIADPILFLCSPLARHITGTVLRVDGGQCTGS